MSKIIIREVFASNLCKLCSERFESVSDAAIKLKINRTQLNRYRDGQSFPSPEVLGRIFDCFGVDANILIVPLMEMPSHAAKVLLADSSLPRMTERFPDFHKALTEIASNEI
ncbi:helix-turn-helix domain-containing protein [Arenibacterium sp. LLYu02]|uniref:helix-turn-helix domain-containing protein n=1 Tax=Arenibacterium sp. LLYu02 TaxID=3404132 RepID=UPI003B221276